MPYRILKPILAGAAAFLLAACASTSRFEGMDAQTLYGVAVEEYEAGDDGAAAEALDRLLLSFPAFEQAAEAFFLLAESYFRDEQYITATSEYTRFLDRYPAHPRAPDAALGVCESYVGLSPISQRDQTFTQQALTVCRNVMADYRGHAAAERAAQHVQEMREKLAKKDYESGDYYLRRDLYLPSVVYFEQVVESYPETPWAPRALLGIIEAYRAIGYEDEVEEARQQLLSRYPDSPEARELGGNVGSAPAAPPAA